MTRDSITDLKDKLEKTITESKDQSPEKDHNSHRESKTGEKSADKKCFLKKRKAEENIKDLLEDKLFCSPRKCVWIERSTILGQSQ